MVHVSFFTLFMKKNEPCRHNKTSYLESTWTQQYILSYLRSFASWVYTDTTKHLIFVTFSFAPLTTWKGSQHLMFFTLSKARAPRESTTVQHILSQLHAERLLLRHDWLQCVSRSASQWVTRCTLTKKKTYFLRFCGKVTWWRPKRGHLFIKSQTIIAAYIYIYIYIRCSCLGNRVWGIVDNQNGYMSSIVKTRHNAPICYTLDN